MNTLLCRSPSSSPVRPWVVVALACVGEFMVVLDASIVNVALPAVRDGLAFRPDTLPWVVNAYALAFGGCLLLGGRLADLFGRGRVFVGGVAVFTCASLVGGSASSALVLLAARAGQGIGAAVLTPATLTVITATFPEGPRRTRALAAWTAVASAGGAAGNLAGGLLTDAWSWRGTLLVNVPIGVVLILLARRHLASDRAAGVVLGVRGAVAATVGIGAITFGVTQLGVDGPSSQSVIWWSLLGASALLVLVLDQARWSTRPLLPSRLAHLPSVVRGNVVMLLAGACYLPMWYFLSLAMQEVLGLGAFDTALGFLPHTLLAVVVGAWVAPRVMRRIDGASLVVAGAALSALGFWWQSAIAVDGGYLTEMLGPAVAISVGLGLLNTPLTEIVNAGVAPEDAGAASGLMHTTKQVGGALGLAALVVVADAPDSQAPSVLAAAHQRAFTGMAVVLGVTAVVALGLPRRVPPRSVDG